MSGYTKINEKGDFSFNSPRSDGWLVILPWNRRSTTELGTANSGNATHGSIDWMGLRNPNH